MSLKISLIAFLACPKSLSGEDGDILPFPFRPFPILLCPDAPASPDPVINKLTVRLTQ